MLSLGSLFGALSQLYWSVFGVPLGSLNSLVFLNLSKCLKILPKQLSIIIFISFFVYFGYLSETLVKYDANDASRVAPGAPLDALWTALAALECPLEAPERHKVLRWNGTPLQTHTFLHTFFIQFLMLFEVLIYSLFTLFLMDFTKTVIFF